MIKEQRLEKNLKSLYDKKGKIFHQMTSKITAFNIHVCIFIHSLHLPIIAGAESQRRQVNVWVQPGKHMHLASLLCFSETH